MIQNAEIAAIFDEIADCLEIQGENFFRVRAYRNAARILRDVPRPVAPFAADEKALMALGGIGKDLAGKIREIVETGDLELHRQVCRRVPAGIRELMGVPGLGPKRAVLLSRKLGVESAAQLRQAAAEHRVRRLKGFGEKMEETILRGVGGPRPAAPAAPRRVLLAQARPFADALVAHLKEVPGARVEAAGSVRRRKETVGDLDVLASGADAKALMDAFAAFDGVAHVLARGGTKMSVVLRVGLQADLRVVPPESFGAALQYFTGSKDHGIQCRKRALARKLKLNEYGVFHGRRRVAGATEADVYAALGLPWIPPELREGRGEVEAALAGRLPRLLELKDLRGDLHMHTDATDGRDALEDMAAAARARGLEYVAVTDHSKRVTMAHGLDADALRRHWDRIDRLAAKTPGIAVLKGVEVDILDDGSLDIPDQVLRGADWVVASLHYGQRQPREKITRRLLAAVRNPVVSALGHPTGRLLGRREPQDCDLDAVLRAAAAAGCAVEIDGQPDRLDLDDVRARAAVALGCRLVVDSDAHSVRELAFLENGVFQARRAWVTKADVVNALPLAQLRKLRRV